MAENREKLCFTFFCIFSFILMFQAFSHIPNDRKLNLLSNGAVESFWDAPSFGIQPFLFCIHLFIHLFIDAILKHCLNSLFRTVLFRIS